MDLDALMGALQATQQKKSSAKLSERNVVELITKLKQLGIFGDDLLHTINGKEYITTDRLKADILTALRQAGGRLELVELPALVGVDLVHCEKQVLCVCFVGVFIGCGCVWNACRGAERQRCRRAKNASAPPPPPAAETSAHAPPNTHKQTQHNTTQHNTRRPRSWPSPPPPTKAAAAAAAASRPCCASRVSS